MGQNTDQQNRALTILIADDDDDDILLTRKAIEAGGGLGQLYCVHDGEELSDYLWHRGDYSDAATAPSPDLILLDLNMPRKNGKEALQEIKSSETLKHIPVVILTNSEDKIEIAQIYRLGASSYMTKPLIFERLLDTMRVLELYYGATADLPRSEIKTLVARREPRPLGVPTAFA